MAFFRPGTAGEPDPDGVIDLTLAGISAADNLLIKAFDALQVGDDERALRFAARAAGLPYDPLCEGNPGWHSAGMMLFNSLADAEEEGEPWLDAAEQALASTPDDGGTLAMRAHLATAAAEWELIPTEQRRCRRLAAGASADSWDDAEPEEPTDRVEPILAALRMTIAFESALDLVEP